MRPSKIEFHMQVALLTATRSTCTRAQVGCVITDPDMEVITIGYNGSFRGGPNKCFFPPEPGKCGCVHAEANAVAKSFRGPKIVFVTTFPCPVCAALLINNGMTQLYYHGEYRTTEGKEVIEAAMIPYKLVDVEPPTLGGRNSGGRNSVEQGIETEKQS